MIVRKEEFLALKQDPLSVSEYMDKFLQLSRYAPRRRQHGCQEAVPLPKRFG
jgi:hypothetical protein